MPDLGFPVASIELNDSTYTSGLSGIFVGSDLASPALAVDCTFDHYFAVTPESTEFEIVGLDIEGDHLVLNSLSVPSEVYSIWGIDDLTNWEEDTDSIVGAIAEQTRVEISLPSVLRRYY